MLPHQQQFLTLKLSHITTSQLIQHVCLDIIYLHQQSLHVPWDAVCVGDQPQTVQHAQLVTHYQDTHVPLVTHQTQQREASSFLVWLSSALSYIISSELSDLLNIDIYKL